MMDDHQNAIHAPPREAIPELGHKAVLAETAGLRSAKLKPCAFAMVITDMQMPKMAVSLSQKNCGSVGNLPVLVITGFGTIENACRGPCRKVRPGLL